jgi:hypothetical protein
MSLTVCLLSIGALSGSLDLSDIVTRQVDYTIDFRDFKLPISVKPADEDRIASIHLYLLAQDRGWRHVSTISPDQDGFPFRALADGIFVFALQVEYKDGRKQPPEMGKGRMKIMRIRVDTRQRTTSAKPSDDGAGVYKMPYAK